MPEAFIPYPDALVTVAPVPAGSARLAAEYLGQCIRDARDAGDDFTADHLAKMMDALHAAGWGRA